MEVSPTDDVTETTPTPSTSSKPELPDDGRPRPQLGANGDAKTWVAVQMEDDPTMWKVTDEKGINVADRFHSVENTQKYIDYYVWEQSQAPPTAKEPPTPEPTPTTTSEHTPTSIELDGIWRFSPPVGDPIIDTVVINQSESESQGRAPYIDQVQSQYVEPYICKASEPSGLVSRTWGDFNATLYHEINHLLGRTVSCRDGVFTSVPFEATISDDFSTINMTMANGGFFQYNRIDNN